MFYYYCILYFFFSFGFFYYLFTGITSGNILRVVTDGLISFPQLVIASASNPSASLSVSPNIIGSDDEVKNLVPDEIIKIFFDFLLFTPKVDMVRIQSVLFAPYFAGNFVVDDFINTQITPLQDVEVSSPASSLQILSQNKCSQARSVVYLIEGEQQQNQQEQQSQQPQQLIGGGGSRHSVANGPMGMSHMYTSQSSSQVCLFDGKEGMDKQGTK